jgi:hypothetical protein
VVWPAVNVSGRNGPPGTGAVNVQPDAVVITAITVATNARGDQTARMGSSQGKSNAGRSGRENS